MGGEWRKGFTFLGGVHPRRPDAGFNKKARWGFSPIQPEVVGVGDEKSRGLNTVPKKDHNNTD